MNALFSQLLRQSLAAGWIILVLLLLRPALKKAPRWVSCLLWGLAAVRLAVPMAVQSSVSLMPQAITTQAGEGAVYEAIRAGEMASPFGINVTHIPAPAASVQGFSWETVLPWLWLAGAVIMAAYALFSYIRLLRRVQVSMRVGKGLYLCDNVASPFILGIFRPRIYLPSDMEEARTRLVLAHERAHLRRGDHLWKPLGYALLTLHWFNPLCWAAYLLFCRDMEQACDESVVKDMSPQDKKAYSAALVSCAMPRSAVAACPLAFGEVGVKQRIRGILNYRKPKFWVVVLCAVLCVVLAAGFLTDPVEAHQAEAGVMEDADTRSITVYASPSEDAQVLCQLGPEADYTILDRMTIGNRVWAYVECREGTTLGWIFLIEGPETIITGTATEDLNVRSGPSLMDSVVGFVPSGGQVVIYEVVTSDGVEWGNTGADAWVCMSYIEPSQDDSQSLEATVSTEPETGTISKKTDIRSAPSEDARVVGQTEPGIQYDILQKMEVGGKTWCYVQGQQEDSQIMGWILLDAWEGTLAQDTTLYAGHSTQEPVLTTLPAGTAYTVDSYYRRQGTRGLGAENWAYIQYRDGEGWIRLDDQETEPAVNQAERCTFAQPTSIYGSPSEESQAVYEAAAGETCTITRREFIGDGSWGYVQLESASVMGWVHFVEEDEALNYFREYVAAFAQPTPEEVEQYLYFANDYRRELFRRSYAPITGWYPSGIFRVNDSLWGIVFSDGNSGRSVYSFVGRMEDRLYVFQNAHDVPEALRGDLDVAAYEEENAMYISDGYAECMWVQNRLLEFRAPVKVEIWEDTDNRDWGTVTDGNMVFGPMSYEDMVCGTDTWRVARELPNAAPHCTITLTAADGSTARLWDVDGSVLISRPGGTQEIYRVDFTGDQIISMIYHWAKELAG